MVFVVCLFFFHLLTFRLTHSLQKTILIIILSYYCGSVFLTSSGATLFSLATMSTARLRRNSFLSTSKLDEVTSVSGNRSSMPLDEVVTAVTSHGDERTSTTVILRVAELVPPVLVAVRV